MDSPEAMKRARIVKNSKLAGLALLFTKVVEQRSRLVNLVANHDKAKHQEAKTALEDKQGEDQIMFFS